MKIKEMLREMCTYSIGVFHNGEIKRTVTLMQDLRFPKDEIIKRLITDLNCDELLANEYYDKYSVK